jgi:uncharacterized protein (UPF0216 family)
VASADLVTQQNNMRLIDTMTPTEIETLKLKGMLVEKRHMITRTQTDTTTHIIDRDEVKRMANDAISNPNLKSLNIFVWADKSAGIEVKISYDTTTVAENAE